MQHETIVVREAHGRPFLFSQQRRHIAELEEMGWSMPLSAGSGSTTCELHTETCGTSCKDDNTDCCYSDD